MIWKVQTANWQRANAVAARGQPPRKPKEMQSTQTMPVLRQCRHRCVVSIYHPGVVCRNTTSTSFYVLMLLILPKSKLLLPIASFWRPSCCPRCRLTSLVGGWSAAVSLSAYSVSAPAELLLPQLTSWCCVLGLNVCPKSAFASEINAVQSFSPHA